MGLEQAKIDSWIVKWIGGGLKAYEETIVAAGTAGKFSFGDTPTLADICLMPQVFAAARFKVDISGLPYIQRIKASWDQLAGGCRVPHCPFKCRSSCAAMWSSLALSWRTSASGMPCASARRWATSSD